MTHTEYKLNMVTVNISVTGLVLEINQFSKNMIWCCRSESMPIFKVLVYVLGYDYCWSGQSVV